MRVEIGWQWVKGLFLLGLGFLAALAIGLAATPAASGVRTVHLDQTSIGRIKLVPGRSTVLSFPTKPGKVILGNQGMFAVEYIENDIAIGALSAKSRSNLFVYLEGRRFSFDLVAVPENGDTLVLVRDAVDPASGAPTPEKGEAAPRRHDKKASKEPRHDD